jgi:DNA invertase Pin-like site-specific DNA recombinase/phage FluMu protein Com
MSTKNAVLYTRVSTEEQAKGNSLQYQMSYLKDYCQRNNYEVINEFEEDHSAKTFKRPKWSLLTEFCRINKRSVDLVLFTRWDRFSRNYKEAWHQIDYFNNLGIEINSAENPLDFTNPDNKFMMAFFLVAPEVENDKISKRTKEGTHAAQIAGKFTNKAPKGYTNVQYSDKDRRIIPNEKEAHILKNAFEELAKGVKSIEYVRHEINKKGVIIGKSAFPELLKNQVYIGNVLVKEWAGKLSYWTQGLHEAIIDDDTFWKVQETHFGKKKGPKLCRAADPDFYLRRFLVCPKCGGVLTACYSKGNGGYYGYYKCPHCNRFNSSAIKANQKFVEYIRQLKLKESALALYEEILKDSKKERTAEVNKEINKLQSELLVEDSRLDSIDTKLMDGEISPEDHQRMKKGIEVRLGKINFKLTSFKAQNVEVERKLVHAINVIRNMDEILFSARVENKILLIGSMFPEKILFDGENYRTNSYNKVLEWIFQNTNDLRKKKTEGADKKSVSSVSVPGAGIEHILYISFKCFLYN